jgi:hypothetical protein
MGTADADRDALGDRLAHLRVEVFLWHFLLLKFATMRQEDDLCAHQANAFF